MAMHGSQELPQQVRGSGGSSRCARTISRWVSRNPAQRSPSVIASSSLTARPYHGRARPRAVQGCRSRPLTACAARTRAAAASGAIRRERRPSRATLPGGATFYTLVTRGTVEQEHALHRRLFLTEQGYRYFIEDWSDGEEAQDRTLH